MSLVQEAQTACKEFQGEWGQVGLCTVLQGCRRDEYDTRCTPEDQSYFVRCAPSSAWVGSERRLQETKVTEESLSNPEASGCLWVNEDFGAIRVQRAGL